MKNRKITAICPAFALSCSMAGCSRVSEKALRPALGLQWYHTPETVKAQLSDFTLLNERESTGTAGEWQLLLDYDVTNLYDTECTLTLCFTSLGLVGLNYHDIQHEKTYQEWSLALESVYGIPTEESRGLVGVNYFDDNPANYQYWVSRLTDIYDTPTDTQYDYTAWTDSPVGNGTQIYIFALEDGVQISFFADDSGSELS